MKKLSPEDLWILGATGYVGSKVAKHLWQQRQEGLRSERLTTFGHRTIDPWLMQETNFFSKHLGGLDAQLFEQFAPSAIFHCARLAGKNDRGRKAAAATGKKANEQLLDLAGKYAPNAPIVYCSGTLMYGNTEAVADERQPLSPIAYARAYALAEQPFLKAQEVGTGDVRMARPAWILGADSWFEHFFFKPALEHKKVPYYGDGAQKMSILSVEDCSGLLAHVLTDTQKNQSYNLSVFEPISQRDFAAKVAAEMEVELAGVSKEALIKKTGKTVSEALLSNTPITTMHKSWRDAYQPVHSDLDALIRQTVARLKAKYGV